MVEVKGKWRFIYIGPDESIYVWMESYADKATDLDKRFVNEDIPFAVYEIETKRLITSHKKEWIDNAIENGRQIIENQPLQV